MRDKPGFDELEPPEIVPTPIDGMSDEQWAERNERHARIIRIVGGVLFGLAGGLVLVTRLSPSSPHYLLGAVFVVVGSVLLFVALALRGDDEEILRLATSWFPELALLERLPLWLLVAVLALGVSLAAATLALFLVSLFPVAIR